jgi:hypothetical protein
MGCLPCEKAAAALLKAGNKAANIAEGYKNLLVTNSEIEELASNRLKICSPCSSKLPLVKIKDKQYYICKECNCPLDAKTRSTGEQCDLKKW